MMVIYEQWVFQPGAMFEGKAKSIAKCGAPLLFGSKTKANLSEAPTLIVNNFKVVIYKTLNVCPCKAFQA